MRNEKRLFLIFSLVTLVIAGAVTAVSTYNKNQKLQQQSESYTQQLAGTVYTALENYNPSRTGSAIAHFRYTLYLEEDHTCKIDASYQSLRGDKETEKFTLDGLTWNVQVEENKVVLFLGGEMDWSKISSAKLDRRMEITAYFDGEELSLKAIRDTYHSVSFYEKSS